MSLVSDRGHIELDRQVDSIVVGQRHRRDPGDLTPLVDSLKRVGLLQPITITPEGHLICGFRRLEAAKALQWRTVRVWVRSGLSDELTRLLAERAPSYALAEVTIPVREGDSIETTASRVLEAVRTQQAAPAISPAQEP